RVERAPHHEIGWTTIATARPDLIDAGPWLEWHYDRFELPAGVPALATTPLATQAFTVGRALGVQFHPDATESELDARRPPCGGGGGRSWRGPGSTGRGGSRRPGPWPTARRGGPMSWCAASSLTLRPAPSRPRFQPRRAPSRPRPATLRPVSHHAALSGPAAR